MPPKEWPTIHKGQECLRHVEGCVALDNLPASAGLWAFITPTITGAVIRDDASEFCDFRLNKSPIDSNITDTCIKNNGRTSCPRTIYVEAIATDIHHLPGGGYLLSSILVLMNW